jgi:hypothetical protein
LAGRSPARFSGAGAISTDADFVAVIQWQRGGSFAVRLRSSSSLPERRWSGSRRSALALRSTRSEGGMTSWSVICIVLFSFTSVCFVGFSALCCLRVVRDGYGKSLIWPSIVLAISDIVMCCSFSIGWLKSSVSLPSGGTIAAAVIIALSGHCFVALVLWLIVWCCHHSCRCNSFGVSLSVGIVLSAIPFIVCMVVLFNRSAAETETLLPVPSSS